GGYRDHSFVILATVAIEPQWQSALHVKQYYDFLDERRWQELLRLREWNDAADTLIGFAFRCAGGRVGIVTMLSPARPGLPDTPLHRSEEHTSELQSRSDLVCRLLLEKKKKNKNKTNINNISI